MKNEYYYLFYLSTYVFSGVDVFVLQISSSVVVKYFVLKSFDHHIHGNENSYAQKITIHSDVRIEVEIHILERQ